MCPLCDCTYYSSSLIVFLCHLKFPWKNYRFLFFLCCILRFFFFFNHLLSTNLTSFIFFLVWTFRSNQSGSQVSEYFLFLRIRVCIDTIALHFQTKVICTIHSVWLFRPSHIYFCIFKQSICRSNLWCFSPQSAGAVEYTEQDPLPKECPAYDTKQSDSEVPVMLEFWAMRSTPSLPSLAGPLWPGMVAPDRALSMS